MSEIENRIADRMFGDPEFDSSLCREVREAKLTGVIINWELVSERRLVAATVSTDTVGADQASSKPSYSASEVELPVLSSDFRRA